MTPSPTHVTTWHRRVVTLSILLFFFTLPHTLEDFALGEPAKAGVPAPFLALVISGLVALQAAGLYWLGQGQRRGSLAHILVGLFWPLASGMAQLPTILSSAAYRSGLISIVYVMGMIGVGLLLSLAAIFSLKETVR